MTAESMIDGVILTARETEWELAHSLDHTAVLAARRAAAIEAVGALVEALAELVDCNERYNAAVQTIIHRPPDWDDGYLAKARAALARFEAQK